VKVLALSLIGSGWLTTMIGVMAMCRVAAAGDVVLGADQGTAKARAWTVRGPGAQPAPEAFRATGGQPPSSVRG
jgi:hypothetical protein